MGKIYEQLSIEERTKIQMQLEAGLSPAAIALGLNRSPSTISRELHRNGWSRPKVRPGPGRPLMAGGYRSEGAHKRARACRVMPRIQRRLQPGNALWGQVMEYLQSGYSPEQISGTLKLVHPETPTLQVSHETIYTAIYAMPRGELRKEVIGWLRFGHTKRRPRARGEDRRGRIPAMVSIHDRPPEIEERLIPGHWEGDLIKGAGNRSAVGTLVERTTLFTVLSRMENATAEAALSGFSHVLNRIEAQTRLSLTYDQGKEMTAHQQLAAATGVKVYFADPHSPWQRGINENTNGLLRQYLPKGRDLSQYTQEELDAIAWKLNTRPRRSLGFKCPAELFTPDDFDFKKHHASLFALGG
ncbi:MAG TPA: IS30 family transposase [Desulfuromonadales bacterium]|nr:IS30 family transposase [Desulfuromonadales bacterium]